MEWLSFQRAVWIFARWVETQIYGASKFILCIGGTTSNSFLPRFFSEAKFAACTIKCSIIKWEVGRSSNVWWKIHPLQVIHSYFKVLLTIKYQAQKSTQIYKFTTMQDLCHWDICVFWVISVTCGEHIPTHPETQTIYGSRRNQTIIGGCWGKPGWEMGSL